MKNKIKWSGYNWITQERWGIFTLIRHTIGMIQVLSKLEKRFNFKITLQS
jgi:hypothetical protein